jgi:mannitol-specific phosphotransferase system IIBC component
MRFARSRVSRSRIYSDSRKRRQKRIATKNAENTKEREIDRFNLLSVICSAGGGSSAQRQDQFQVFSSVLDRIDLDTGIEGRKAALAYRREAK